MFSRILNKIKPAPGASGPWRFQKVGLLNIRKHVKHILPAFVYVGFLAALVLVKPLTTVSESMAVAKVNGVVLTERDLSEAINKIFPMAGFHGKLTPDKVKKFRPRALKLMVEKELLYQEARARGMKVEKSRMNKIIKEKTKNIGGSKAFRKALKNQGMTKKEFERRLEKIILVDELTKAAVDDLATVSEEDIQGYYERNKEGFKRPEAMKLRHILVSVKPNAMLQEKQDRRKRAEEVVAKLKAGEDMASLAWTYSDDPYRVKGGDLGLVHKGMLDPDLEAQVLKLKEGETSGVIETIYGFHVVRLEKKVAPTQLSLKDVRARVSAKFREKKKKALREALIEGLREKAEIEVY